MKGTEMMDKIEAVLSIAGSDSSGGAGIQADIKTIMAHGLFAECAITALTAQNTTGVYGVLNVDPAFVEQQIDVVFDDIRPAAVKIGMVSDPEIVHAIAAALQRNNAQNIVVDPVMVATSGSALIVDEAVDALVSELFPLSSVVTPNLPEASALCGFEIASERDMERATEAIARLCGGAVLIKGGHFTRDDASVGDSMQTDKSEIKGVLADAPVSASEDASSGEGANAGESASAPGSAQASDLLRLRDGELVWLRAPRIDTQNTHGTGCTLSSAIACGLARGLVVTEAVCQAKAYVSGALGAGLNLGRGSGPLDHAYEFRRAEIFS